MTAVSANNEFEIQVEQCWREHTRRAKSGVRDLEMATRRGMNAARRYARKLTPDEMLVDTSPPPAPDLPVKHPRRKKSWLKGERRRLNEELAATG